MNGGRKKVEIMMNEKEVKEQLKVMKDKFEKNSLSELDWANLNGYIAALENVLGFNSKKDVISEAERIEKILPKDPMAIIKRASERLRRELGEEVEDGISEVE